MLPAVALTDSAIQICLWTLVWLHRSTTTLLPLCNAFLNSVTHRSRVPSASWLMTHQPFALSFFANVDLPEPGRPTRRRTRAGPLEAPTPQSPRGLGDFPCSRHLPLSEGSGWLPSGYVDRSPPPRSEPRFFFAVTHSPAIARRRFSHTTPHPFLDRLDRSSFRVLLMISANPKVCFFFVCLLIDETVAPHRSSCSALGDFSRKDGWRWLIGRCFFSYVLSQVHSSHTPCTSLSLTTSRRHRRDE